MLELIKTEKTLIKSVKVCWGCTQKFSEGSFMTSVTMVKGKRKIIQHWCYNCRFKAIVETEDWKPEIEHDYGCFKGE